MTEPHPLQAFELAQCAIKVFFEAGETVLPLDALVPRPVKLAPGHFLRHEHHEPDKSLAPGGNSTLVQLGVDQTFAILPTTNYPHAPDVF
jgi:hypothetical protein